MVSLTIDGKAVAVSKESTILEAAAKLGIKIPTLCWLKKVSPTGACRVCVVEVEGVDRPMTACNTPVKEGISVTTSTPKLEAIRKKVVELMLVNHPLDCPVCDAGGECELQDSCYAFGVNRPEYAAVPERRKIRYDWPLIESDPNRCILCEKCVKVDHEIVRAEAIEVKTAGEATVVDTLDCNPLNCEFCGNCVGVCPVGALIHKPSKFRGRPWTFSKTKSVCAFCAVGCELEYHSRNGRVERTVSRQTTFNHGNLCINGRYGYAYVNSAARLTEPMIRETGGQTAVDWSRAMAFAAERLQSVIASAGPDAVAGIGSPRVTNEENYLFQKLFRGAIGTNNIDSEARFGYAKAQDILRKALGTTGATATIDKVDHAGAVLVFGADLNAEATGLEYRVIKATTKNDARLVLANMRDVKLKKLSNSHLRYRSGAELLVIQALTKLVIEAGLADAAAVSAPGFAALKEAVANVDIAAAAVAAGTTIEGITDAAMHLAGKKSVAVIFGVDLIRSVQAEKNIAALVNLALVLGAVGKETGGIFPVDEKNNVQGLLDMGVAPDCLPGYRGLSESAAFGAVWKRDLPQKAGKDAMQIIEGIEKGDIKALYLLGSNPATFPGGQRILKALEKLELLIVEDIFPNEVTQLAHVVFPAAAAAEKSGSFTTTDNRVQPLAKAKEAPGNAREDWDILSDLYDRLTMSSTPASPAAIFEEIKAVTGMYSGYAQTVEGACLSTGKAAGSTKISFQEIPAATAVAGSGMTLLAGPILFHSGTTSTWSENNREVSPEGFLELSAADAAAMGISDGVAIRLTSAAGSISGKAKISTRMQNGLVFAPIHFSDLPVASLLDSSANVASVKVEKA